MYITGVCDGRIWLACVTSICVIDACIAGMWDWRVWLACVWLACVTSMSHTPLLDWRISKQNALSKILTLTYHFTRRCTKKYKYNLNSKLFIYHTIKLHTLRKLIVSMNTSSRDGQCATVFSILSPFNYPLNEQLVLQSVQITLRSYPLKASTNLSVFINTNIC